MNDNTTTPGEARATAPPPVTALDRALEYLAAGLSVVPIRTDGTKKPTTAWKEYQSRRMTPEEARRYFAGGAGVAIVGGAISGGLEILDFDAADAWRRYRGMLELLAGPGALERLDRLPQVETPAGGRHVYFRSPRPEGNRKLALDAAGEVLIETRGEGGYVLAPGCPPQCHPSGLEYRHAAGPPIAETPAIEGQERQVLLAAAAALNEYADRAEYGPKEAARGDNRRPGDDFNQRATWEEILEPHKWRIHHQDGSDRGLWTRPGKDTREGYSATTGYCRGQDGRDLLYVFSSSAAPLEAGKAYSRFAAFTMLNYSGDFSAAARALAAKGYGSRMAASRRERVEGPHGLAAEIISKHRTAQHLTVRADILLAGVKKIPGLELTLSDRRLSEAASEVLRLFPAAEARARRPEVVGFLRAVRARAEEQLTEQAAGPTMHELAMEHITASIAPTARDDRSRLWSAKRREWLYCRQYCEAVLTSQLIERLQEASDFEGGPPSKRRRAVREVVTGTWADFMERLPLLGEAEIEKDGATAEELKRILLEILIQPRVFSKDDLDRDSATTTSLIALALRHLDRELESLSRRLYNGLAGKKQEEIDSVATERWRNLDWGMISRWHQVHKSYAVWVRTVNAAGDQPPLDPDTFADSLAIEIGLRSEILLQTRTAIPGVRDQETFRRLIVQAGLARPEEAFATRRGSRKRARLAVACAHVIDEACASFSTRE